MDPHVDPSLDADHLCVLVHGLWGNPSHMDFIAASLRERYPSDTFHVLAAQSNAGNNTYDGIELGGERLALEIEETLDSLDARGSRVGKLSVVGYSLGGLVARYALGLLYARGWFDRLVPVNFTTFVSPHVGVRIPVTGLRSFLWNYLGPHTISASGRQLFLVDSFRDSGKPLLSLLADPDSVFMRALAKFKHRSAYANVVNDRSTVFYTTAISLSDPFQRDLERAHIKYVAGYEPVVIDPNVYFALPGKKEEEHLPLSSRIRQQAKKLSTDLSLWLFFTLLMSIALPIFLVNSVIQTSRSQQRIQLHEEGKSGASFGHYRIPLFIKDAQNAVEGAFERAASRQDPEYLSATDQSTGEGQLRKRTSATSFPVSQDKSRAVLIHEEEEETGRLELGASGHDNSHQPYPSLALTPLQRSIVKSLNAVGFRKYPIYIHNHRHSHAAIIRRVPKKGFDEAPVVIQHWLDTEFAI